MTLQYLFLPALLIAGALPTLAQEAKKDTTKTEHLDEVTVKAQKGFIENQPGKTIVNVQAMSGLAGKSVLDMLRAMPGIVVDGKGNISLVGRDGVMVMIDGRPTYLDGDDLRDLLRGMTAEEVGQVEIMTQPPAQYDAAGNSGIVNIKTRRSRKAGMNGSLSSSYSKSLRYATNTTALLNYRKNKVNIYARLNYIDASGTVDWTQDLRFTGNNATSFMHSVPVEVFQKSNDNIGVDYFASDKTSMGLSGGVAYYLNTMHSDIDMRDELRGSVVTSHRDTYESSTRRNASAHGFLKHTFGNIGELNINLDYLRYTREMDQYLQTSANRDGIPLPNQMVLRSSVPYMLNIYSARADQEINLKNGLKLEAGGKYSYVVDDNNTHFYQPSGGDWINDPSRTNHFLYTEHISALYAKGTKKIGKKLDAQLGLREEVAVMAGNQLTTGQVIKRNLPALFPTAYIVYKADSSNTFELNYGRRLERPEYRALNPFNYYTFYATYQRGNPYLLPQYSHQGELKHTWKGILTTSLQGSLTQNEIGYINGTDTGTLTMYGMPVNLGTTRSSSLTVSYNNNVTKWWGMMASATARYGWYANSYNGYNLSGQGAGYSAEWYNQFTIRKWMIDAYAAWNSYRVTTAISADLWNLYTNMSISRKLLKDKLNARLIVNDPFYIFRNAYCSFQPDLTGSMLLRTNSRDITIAATYNFGKKPDKDIRHEDTRPEEGNRMKM